MNTNWFIDDVMWNIVQDFMQGKFKLDNDFSQIRWQHDNTFLNRDTWSSSRFTRYCEENIPFKILFTRP